MLNIFFKTFTFKPASSKFYFFCLMRKCSNDVIKILHFVCFIKSSCFSNSFKIVIFHVFIKYGQKALKRHYRKCFTRQNCFNPAARKKIFSLIFEIRSPTNCKTYSKIQQIHRNYLLYSVILQWKNIWHYISCAPSQKIYVLRIFFTVHTLPIYV